MIREARSTSRSIHFGSLAAALLLALGAATSTLFTQVQQCSFQFSPPSASFDESGGTSSVTCTSGSLVASGASIGCSWTAASNVSWIVINSGASSSGSGTVQYTVLANTSSVARTGTITFSGVTSYQSATYTITQTGISGSSPSTPFVAAPAILTFVFQRGQAVPAAQTLNISSSVRGAAFFTLASTNSGGNWLAVSPGSGTTGAPGSAVPLSVSVSPAGLTPGTYTGSVTISQPLLLNRTVNTLPGLALQVPVTLTVSDAAPPTAPFTLTPSALIFYYQRGQAVPAAQTLNVSSAASGAQFAASVSENSGGPWLSVSTSSASAGSSGSPVPISVSVNPIGLKPGIYTGNISLSPPVPVTLEGAPFNAATTNTATAAAAGSTPVTLTVSDTAPPALIVPPIFRFQFDPTQPGPQTQPLTITSPNGVPTPFTVTPSVLTPVGADWISFDKTGGTTPATINVTVNPVGLHPGRYLALVEVTAGSPPPINLGVGPGAFPRAFRDATAAGPLCTASPLSTAVVLDNGANPWVGTQQMYFSDTTPSELVLGLNPLNMVFLQLTPMVVSLNTTDCGWLSITPPYMGSTPAMFDVTATTSSYPAQLSGYILVNDGNNATATAVSVEATSGDSVWVSDDYQYSVALTLSSSAGGQQSQNINISNPFNPAATSATITPQSDAGWLSAPNQTIAVPGTVTITATAQPGALPMGTYGGWITITGSGVNSPPLTIPVSLTMTQ